MSKYIFLDNWVYSLLTNEDVERRLSAFLKRQNYTVLITSLSLVELYNPGWETEGEKDRMYKVVQFLSKLPCFIVKPENVFSGEIDTYPQPLQEMPIELDLREVPEQHRSQVLLNFLKG